MATAILKKIATFEFDYEYETEGKCEFRIFSLFYHPKIALFLFMSVVCAFVFLCDDRPITLDVLYIYCTMLVLGINEILASKNVKQ